MTNNERALIQIETTIAMKISDVRCFITKEEADRCEELRKLVGKKYDAVNRVWEELED